MIRLVLTSLLTVFIVLTASTGRVLAQQVVPHAYLRMKVDGGLRINVHTADDAPGHIPLVAYITPETSGSEGALFPANTLVISGAYTKDVLQGKRRIISISLYNVEGTGTYQVLEHDCMVMYVDATDATYNEMSKVRGWGVGERHEKSSGTITITEVGDRLAPGLGWPVKGHFNLNATKNLGDLDDDGEDEIDEVSLVGEFSWGDWELPDYL